MAIQCVYCGWIGNPQDFEVDHSVPVSRGGSNTPVNLQYICSGCNRQKGSMTSEEYQAWRIVYWFRANFGPLREVKS